MVTADDKYRKILRDNWGYDDFRGIQREIIDSICAGRDTLGLMPTGEANQYFSGAGSLYERGMHRHHALDCTDERPGSKP